jgi:LemA protein
MELWITLGVIGAIIFFLIAIYNRLVALRQNRRNAFADIDVQLKQRVDLIPNLVETVKGYAGHEKEALENVTEARSRAMHAGGTKDRAAAESALGGALMNLLAVAENYPDLKANQNFLQLQAEISDIENKIAASRRFFNNATNEYNTAIEQFPASVVAKSFGFLPEEFFDLGENRTTLDAAPQVSFAR